MVGLGRVGRVGLVGLALVSVVHLGCYESSIPLDTSPQTDLDPRVLGGWRCMFAEPDSHRVFAMELKSSGNRGYQATTMVAGGDLGRYHVYASTVKGSPLVNVQSLQAEPDEKPWVFVRYELLGPSVLHVRAVRDALLQGADGSPAAIRKAIEQAGNDEAYEDAFVCLRLK